MLLLRKLLLITVLAACVLNCPAQRTYRSSSVLSTGSWYKFSVSEAGVYKLDVSFLNSLGLSGNIPSSQVRIYGNGGNMLPEAAGAAVIDDLEENAIQVVDGGDGTLNGQDYILLYASGPDEWLKDSLGKSFTHRKNLYSNRSYYFLTVGGSGLRIPQATGGPGVGIPVTSYNERYFHELDSVNLLYSGREWYGEEFASAPGKSLQRNFALPFNDIPAQTATITSTLAARSINAVSRFLVNVNGSQVQQIDINGVAGGTYDFYASQQRVSNNFGLQQPSVNITYAYQTGSFNSQGWLNSFELQFRRHLNLQSGRQMLFRDWNSVGAGTVSFSIGGADGNTQVWDVTNPLKPVRMAASLIGNNLVFYNDAQRLREYAAFSTTYLVPNKEDRPANQNLHADQDVDLLIVTHPSFYDQALKIAQFHQQKNNIKVTIVTTQQVFNEFSSGSADPTAIRDLMKMYYDRNKAAWASRPRNLLLLGRASFDYKDRLTNNTNLVPVYQSVNSLDPLNTYCTDDYFGFLDDNEDINSTVILNLLDVGVGRLPVTSSEAAANIVNKIYDYHAAEAFGPWRNNLNLVADDEDQNTHLYDAESFSQTLTNTAPVFNQQKIYLDAFRQENGSAGGRYPVANTVVNNNINNGTLIWNYNGHGGPQRLAEEVILEPGMVNTWSNRYRLPLFITATCDFVPFDNPNINSFGANILDRPKTGGIALMTTTRPVFAFSNRVMNNYYLQAAFERDASGRYRSLGQAMMVGKNLTYSNSNDIVNNRKFSLLGDPAMTLAFPQIKARVTNVNGNDVLAGVDTLSATEYAVLEGEVTDLQDQPVTNFTGNAYLTLFDKAQTMMTLGNDPGSTPAPYPSQENGLFRGKASVSQGKFTFRFRVPRDINYQFGNGKASLYVEDGSKDGNGQSTSIVIGGISNTAVLDEEGPRIRGYMNDTRFVNGGLTNAAPILLLQLSDSSGINTGGSGIDHDIVATLDGDNKQYYVLNNFYESALNNYQEGTVRFQLPALSAGLHTLHIKAWDVLNNSAEATVDFVVGETGELVLKHVLNYPNPFTTRTHFWFEHNYPSQDLIVKVEIFSVAGRLIKTISQTINTMGNRSSDVEWDGRDEYGQRIGRGVYLYRLRVRTPDGKTAEEWQKLAVLN